MVGGRLFTSRVGRASRASTQPVRIEPADPRPSIERDPVAAPWTVAIDRIVHGQPVSVAVGSGRRLVYQHLGDRARLPASNQKLVLSMAALDTFGPSHRFVTVARASRPLRHGVLPATCGWSAPVTPRSRLRG